MQKEIKAIDIFERLRSGETIQPNDPEAYKMIEASFATKKLLVRMNNTGEASEVRNLLIQITGSEIDESTIVFTPIFINYGKHIKIGKTYSLISIAHFWTWEVLPLRTVY